MSPQYWAGHQETHNADMLLQLRALGRVIVIMGMPPRKIEKQKGARWARRAADDGATRRPMHVLGQADTSFRFRTFQNLFESTSDSPSVNQCSSFPR
jgi:hypothetical protein